MLTQAQIETVRAAKKVASLLEEFRKLNPEMQAQQMAIFLAVAGKPDSTVTELGIATGQPTNSASRNVAALSKTHRKGLPGLDLLTAVEDEMDRRTKRIRLTPKGVRVMASLEGLL
jgi:DNA-binding MarR family transcriptional regulator